MSNEDGPQIWDRIVADPSYVSDLQLGKDLILYIRSSTKEQETSCRQQIEKLEEVLRDWGVLGPDQEVPKEGNLHRPDLGLFVDEGVSGWKKRPEDRDGSQALLNYTEDHKKERGAPGYVLVWSLSRYGRFPDGPEEAFYEIYRLKKRGWRMASMSESNLDTDDQARLMSVIEVALASEQHTSASETKSRDTTRGNDDAARKGIWRGGQAPFGYRRIVAEVASDGSGDFEKVATLEPGQHNGYPEADTLFEPDPIEAEWLEWAFEAYAYGDEGEEMSLSKIAKRLNRAEEQGKLPSTSDDTQRRHNWIKKLLTNNAYRAVQIDSQEERHDALWEPLVPSSLWRTVQKKLEENSYRRGDPNKGYLLSGGLLQCSECGEDYHGTRNQSGDHYLYYYRTDDEISDCPACDKRIRVEDVDLPLIELIEERIADHPTVRARIQKRTESQLEGEDDLSELIQAKERMLEDLDDQMDRLVNLHVEGRANENVEKKLDGLRRQYQTVEAELEQLRRDADGSGVPSQKFANLAANFGAILEKAAPAERKQLAAALIVKVEVDQRDESAEVHFRDPDGGLVAVA